MKTLKPYLFAFAIFITVFSGKIKAQADPNIGFYVDGVKVTELTCYSFKKMTLVLPYNSGYNNYSMFLLQCIYTKPNPGGGYFYEFFGYISKASLLSTNLKGKYIVYDLFIDGSETANVRKDPEYQIGKNVYTTRGALATYPSKEDEPTFEFVVKFQGQTISGTEEKWDDGCECLKKVPKYSNPEDITQISILCKNRTKNKSGFIKPVKEAQPCTYSGTNVDFNKLGSGSSSGGSGNVTVNNTVIVKNEITTTTNNASTSSNAAVTSSLKPLDKKKPGYFAEKDGDQISKEGYKKGDALNGEVRIYDEGKIREVSFYVNDKKNGPSTMYYENGKIEMTGNYKDDEKDGEWKMYTDSGKLKETKKYLNGEAQD